MLLCAALQLAQYGTSKFDKSFFCLFFNCYVCMSEYLIYSQVFFFFLRSQYAIDIGGCHVKYDFLGNSMMPGGKVGSFVINAFCRKFFLDERPTKSRKHYFFSSVGVSFNCFVIHN